MGKHKPIWDPSTDCGDYVVAVGLHDLHTTGKKRYQKKYYSHTTRPGSLKEITMDRMMEKWGGSEVLRRAVRGMLPKNRLRDDRMARLKSEFLPIILFAPCNESISNHRICSVRGRFSPLQAKHHQGLHPSFNSTTARGQGCLCPTAKAAMIDCILYYLATTFFFFTAFKAKSCIGVSIGLFRIFLFLCQEIIVNITRAVSPAPLLTPIQKMDIILHIFNCSSIRLHTQRLISSRAWPWGPFLRHGSGSDRWGRFEERKLRRPCRCSSSP